LEEWKIKNERIVPFKFVYACKPMLQVLTQRHLVGASMGEGGGSETNTLVGGIKIGIEALEEGIAVDEVETFNGGRAESFDDEGWCQC